MTTVKWLRCTRWKKPHTVHAYDTSTTIGGEHVSLCEDYSFSELRLEPATERDVRCTLCERVTHRCVECGRHEGQAHEAGCFLGDE